MFLGTKLPTRSPFLLCENWETASHPQTTSMSWAGNNWRDSSDWITHLYQMSCRRIVLLYSTVPSQLVWSMCFSPRWLTKIWCGGNWSSFVYSKSATSRLGWGHHTDNPLIERIGWFCLSFPGPYVCVSLCVLILPLILSWDVLSMWIRLLVHMCLMHIDLKLLARSVHWGRTYACLSLPLHPNSVPSYHLWQWVGTK